EWANKGRTRNAGNEGLRRRSGSAGVLIDEFRDGADQRRGLVAMGRMPAFSEFEQLRLRQTARNAVNVFQRAVFVVQPLHGKNRAGDGSQLGLYGPAGKAGVQPDVVPAFEGGINIVVVARQFLLEASRGIGFAGDAD